MNSRKIILAKNPKLANSRNSRKFLPKLSRIFPLAKVSSAKVSSFKVNIRVFNLWNILCFVRAATTPSFSQMMKNNSFSSHCCPKIKTVGRRSVVDIHGKVSTREGLLPPRVRTHYVLNVACGAS